MSTNKKRFTSLTIGCRANQYQTELIKSRVASRLLRVVDLKDFAGVYLINTCIVTKDAERTSLRAIRRALRQNPKARIIVSGCYARLYPEQLQKEFPQIIIETPFPLARWERGNEGMRVRENLMIQDGCNHFCSYCLVPYARGPVVSKSLDQIMAEAKELAAGGAREIVLTGINLGLYQPDLSRVACHLSKIKNLARIRLSSIEPMYLTRELIDSLTKTPKVCHHLHLPIQSGDNNILKAMGREYSVDDLYRLADQIRTRWPDCGLTTDIIVGFPGEDEQEFQNTVSAIKKINFSRLHVFPYSQRPGTPAAGWPDQVEPRAKNARVKEIRELNRQLMFSFARQYQDKAVEVLVEQPGTGLTSNYIRCSFAETGNSSGQLRRFKVKSILANGELKLDSRK